MFLCTSLDLGHLKVDSDKSRRDASVKNVNFKRAQNEKDKIYRSTDCKSYQRA